MLHIVPKPFEIKIVIQLSYCQAKKYYTVYSLINSKNFVILVGDQTKFYNVAKSVTHESGK